MDFRASAIVLTSLVLSGVSTNSIYYVRPEDLSSLSCPGEPCLTLSQYAEQTSKYFTTGSTFVFLAGNHTGANAIKLANVSEVTLKSNLPSCILCSHDFTIMCDNVTHFTIEGLKFVYSSRYPKNSVMEISNGWNISISHSTFLGTGDLYHSLTRAANCTHSTITFTDCYFEGNTADLGGAIHALGSNVILTNSVFVRNAANLSGGAIFAYENASLSMKDNTFLLNSAVYDGGAVKCNECSMRLMGNHTFQGNSVFRRGGAVSIYRGDLTTAGTPLVSQNRAGYGGGVCLVTSNATFDSRLLIFRNNSAILGVQCTLNPAINGTTSVHM